MKKFLFMCLLTLGCTLTFTACGDDDDDDNSNVPSEVTNGKAYDELVKESGNPDKIIMRGKTIVEDVTDEYAAIPKTQMREIMQMTVSQFNSEFGK